MLRVLIRSYKHKAFMMSNQKFAIKISKNFVISATTAKNLQKKYFRLWQNAV